jgi:primosomal protein N' (replication factor Y)
VVRVLPDIVGIDKEFDYFVPEALGDVRVGDMVRVDLHGRRVGAWVRAVDVEPIDRTRLKPLAKLSGRGPSVDLLDLADWAAWRWAGRRAQLLRTASPPGVVRSIPPGPSRASNAAPAHGDAAASEALIGRSLAAARGVLRLPPGDDRFPLVLAAATDTGSAPDGETLVLCPSMDEARRLGRRLRASGVSATALIADRTGAVGAGEWARAAAGGTVIGTRAGAWAPVSRLGRVVVLDEHDEVYQEERSPTWHARDVVIERARRAGVPCLLVSPCPTLEALAWGELITPGPAAERQGWPHLTVVDQRQRDPAIGPLFSSDLVDLLRSGGQVVCILNRVGRSRLLACVACETLARCERCDAAVALPEPGLLRCPRCGTERPVVCLACGATKMKNLRPGVSRVREELSALISEPVAEIFAGDADIGDTGRVDARVVVGTEAALHRLPRADAVAFLDFDQELLAPRYRGAEQALALLARAARLVRSRPGARHGRLLVQTRTPDHPVLQAVRHADPGRLVMSERPMRRALGLPPSTAMAVVSGHAAPLFVAALGRPTGIMVQGPLDGRWRLTAPDHTVLCKALAAVARPPGRLRIEVDPLRI